ncbi:MULTISPECIES: NAD(P)H-dependent oxidoreductase [unclassified Pseudomonas]|jgi:NAD(P)H dehydrogenase (quinone)|uniref:NAD(P)H-dependent oxidoreductase n=1 Tax=Pseudomonas sp. A-R-26 TaxID=2832404 RepID=UPI001CC15701|nr:NAD(P)H-dependent oxidoreductase [Pseudomonas sp. A-R-26]
MNIYIVSAHPEPTSFTNSLVTTASDTFEAQGHRVRVNDLYAQNFDACEHARHFQQRKDSQRFDVQAEQRFGYENGTLPAQVAQELAAIDWADLLVIQFPLWWFGAPAMLKGWMDRVLVYGGLYSSEQRFEQGVCRGKKVLLCVTTGSSADECAPNGREGNTHMLLWPIQYAFRYVGFEVLQAHLIHGIWAGCTAAGRDLEEELQRYRSHCCNIDQAAVLPFNSPDDWDEHGQLKQGAPSYTPFIQHSHN